MVVLLRRKLMSVARGNGRRRRTGGRRTAVDGRVVGRAHRRRLRPHLASAADGREEGRVQGRKTAVGGVAVDLCRARRLELQSMLLMLMLVKLKISRRRRDKATLLRVHQPT